MASRKVNYLELAKAAFSEGASAEEVAQLLRTNRLPQERVFPLFNFLLGRGYAFYPGLSKYAREYPALAKFDYPDLGEKDMEKLKAEVAEERKKYFEAQAAKEQDDILKEEHPVARRVLPNLTHGRMRDGEREGFTAYLRDYGRSVSDLWTLPFRAPGELAGRAVNAAFDADVKFADMGDVDGAFNDNYLPFAVAMGAGVPGALGAVSSAANMTNKAVRSARLASLANKADAAGRAFQASRVGSSAIGRFGTEAAVDAAGSYSANKLNDVSPEVSAEDAALGGVAGATASRLVPLALSAATSGVKRAARGAFDNAQALARGDVKVGGQTLPGEAANVGKVVKMRPGTQAVPLKRKDDIVDFMLDKENGLGLELDDIPTAALDPLGSKSVAGTAEQNMATSPFGTPYLKRWNNMIQRLNNHVDKILSMPTRDGYTPFRKAYDVIEHARELWGSIKRNSFANHFNFDENGFVGPLADELTEINNKKMGLLWEAADNGGVDAASSALSKYNEATKTLETLEQYGERAYKKANATGSKGISAPYEKEYSDLIAPFEKALKESADKSPLERLKDLETLKQLLDNYTGAAKNEKAPKEIIQHAESVRKAIKKDMRTILEGDWFGDAGKRAVSALDESEKTSAIFMRGEEFMKKWLNPQAYDETGLARALTNGNEYGARVLREALEMGGEEGKMLLEDLKRLALDYTLGKDGATGVNWTSAFSRYKNSLASLEALGIDKNDPIFKQMMMTLEAGSRIGTSPLAPGSSAARNAIGNAKDLAARLAQERQLAAQRRALLADLDLGKNIPGVDAKGQAIKEFGELDAIGTPSTGRAPADAPAAPDAPVPGRQTEARLGALGAGSSRVLGSETGRKRGHRWVSAAAGKLFPGLVAANREENDFERYVRELQALSATSKRKFGAEQE